MLMFVPLFSISVSTVYKSVCGKNVHNEPIIIMYKRQNLINIFHIISIISAADNNYRVESFKKKTS